MLVLLITVPWGGQGAAGPIRHNPPTQTPTVNPDDCRRAQHGQEVAGFGRHLGRKR